MRNYTPPRPPRKGYFKATLADATYHLDILVGLLFGPDDAGMSERELLLAVIYHMGRYVSMERRLVGKGSRVQHFKRVGDTYIGKPINRNTAQAIELPTAKRGFDIQMSRWTTAIIDSGLLPALARRASERGKLDEL